MTVVYVSNFFTHHQQFLSEALHRRTNGQYYFIETESMTQERKRMGWKIDDIPPYVLNMRDTSSPDYQRCLDLIRDADIVIRGSADRKLFEKRLKAGKVLLLTWERIYKQKLPLHLFPKKFLAIHMRLKKKYKLYAMCASAFLPVDFKKTLTLTGKTYKWGYFTEVKQYPDIDRLISDKEPSSLIWVSRMISWKHPEAPLFVASRLKEEGYRFKLRMIGIGPLRDEVLEYIEANKLADCVELLGSMRPEEVRAHMENSEIFLFTSDRNEGWGAVLNEAMNSGCASIASHAIGASPFLIKNGNNGLIFESENVDELYRKTKYLLDHPKERSAIGRAAYFTMTEQWNAENAAERLLALCKEILKNGGKPNLYSDGVCSKAKVLKDNWYSDN